MRLSETLSLWKDLARKGKEKAMELEMDIPEDIDNIFITGMGGSGIIGDVLQDLQLPYYFDYPITTIKEPWLPGRVNDKSIVISLSYSGNTFETITSTIEAINKGARTIIITSGGRLASIANERDIPMIKLTNELLPRAAFPEMFYATITLLSKFKLTGYLSHGIIEESIDFLDNKDEVTRHSKEVSHNISDVHPIFISCKPYSSIAMRFKKDLAENAKKISTVEILPEAGHNSLEALYHLDKNGFYKLVYITGSYSPCQVFVEAVGETLEKIDGFLIDLSNKREVLTEIIWGFWMAGYTSLLLSIENNMDPDATPGLGIFRKKVWERFYGKKP